MIAGKTQVWINEEEWNTSDNFRLCDITFDGDSFLVWEKSVGDRMVITTSLVGARVLSFKQTDLGHNEIEVLGFERKKNSLKPVILNARW